MIATNTIYFVSKGKAEFRPSEMNEELAPDQVLLKTICTLISQGTEFSLLNDSTNRASVKYPVVLGYSAVATVLQVGSAVTDFFNGVPIHLNSASFFVI